MADRLRVLESAKVALEQQLKEINEHRADIVTQNACKDELILELEDLAKISKQESENAKGENQSLKERVKNLEVLVAKKTVDHDNLHVKIDHA